MQRYSLERKETILKRMAPPQSMTVAEVARQEGISEATLYNCKRSTNPISKPLPTASNLSFKIT